MLNYAVIGLGQRGNVLFESLKKISDIKAKVLRKTIDFFEHFVLPLFWLLWCVFLTCIIIALSERKSNNILLINCKPFVNTQKIPVGFTLE